MSANYGIDLPLTVTITLLQDFLNKLYTWSQLWQLPISISKCSVLSISNSKLLLPRSYTIGRHLLPQTTSCSDLGVIMDSKLSFSCHILSIVKKAFRKSALISRCFHSKDATNLKQPSALMSALYSSMLARFGHRTP